MTGDLIYLHRRAHQRLSGETEPLIQEVDPSQLNQLATHLPDVILHANLSVKPPFVRQFSGVVMFLDISGNDQVSFS